MATELPRPGIEVVQEFRSTSPTIVTPTLVPCVVAPFFEVIEVLKADGTVNDDSKLPDAYEQFELSVPQSSFPSPRGNIDEVDVLEDSIRAFFNFGGAISELSRTQAFLTELNNRSSRPYVKGTNAPVLGFDIDGRTLVCQFDSHTALPVTVADVPVSKNTTIVFAATTPGGRLTIEEVVAQINAVIPGTAFDAEDITGVPADAGKLALQSTKWGAKASAVVRYGGTANGVVDGLGFSSAKDEIAVGGGFYAIDDADGDTTSPRIELYRGTSQKLIDVVDVPVVPAVNFNDENILTGDTIYADGVNIGETQVVGSTRLTMEIEQNIISQDKPFAPRRFYIRANNLSYPAPAASSAGTVTGTRSTEAASPAWLVGLTAFTNVGVSESFDVTVVIDGVAQETETISSGIGWANLAAAVAGINGQASDFEAYTSNDNGDEQSDGTFLGLRTKADNVGSGAAITFETGTPGMLTGSGFTTPPYSDIGENIRYLVGTPAKATSTGTWASLVGGMVITDAVTYTPTCKQPGGSFAPESPETITWNSGGSVPATVAAAITFWNGIAKFTFAYESNSSGVPTTGGGYLSVRTFGESVGALAEIDITADSEPVFGVATHNGTDDNLTGTEFKWSIDNNPKIHSVTFVADEDDDGTSLQHVLDKINAETPGVAEASDDSPPKLKLTSQKVGEASQVKVLNGTANAHLGFTDNSSYVGNGRPAPDLALDVYGGVILQGQLLRDGLTGVPFSNGFCPIHLAYKGLRLDVSPDADNPSLLTVQDVTTLEQIANPISTDNPGGLMVYLAKLNAPGVAVAAIGVPEVSDDAPDGTPVGYSKCAEFLQNEEVYALSLASHNQVVHQTFKTHVDFMSEPEQKGERILFFNPSMPTRAQPTLVGSGTDANSTANPNELTVEVNLAPALIAAGLDPNADLNPTSGPIENELYVDLGSDDRYYLIQKVTDGTKIQLRTTFAAGDGNDDSFFSTTDLPSGIISTDWSCFIRGAELVIPGSTKPDKQKIAETIQAVGYAYGDRRIYMVHPDQVGINLTGIEQLVEGYYATACVVGMVGQLPPQQGFTNYPITGLTRVSGSNDFFTQRQLNVMAAGGTYILVQDVQGAPVICRHQLSTDMTSIETRELSITKDVDYVAKFMRGGLRNFIGRSNITQPFLDNLSTVVQGMLNFLVENAVLIGANINNIVQSADQPDTVLIDITLDVPYPCNYIRITLVI